MTRLLLTLLAAGLCILAFPPVHWHPLSLVAVIPFFAAIRDTTPAKALGLGLIFGLSVFAGTLNWLVLIFGPIAALLFLILSLFSAVFAALFSTLQQVAGSRKWFPFATGVMWTGIEYYRSEWFTLRFPWITPGTALPPGYLTPLVGVYGVSLIIITGAAAVVLKKPRIGIALILLAGFTAYLPKPRAEANGPTIAAIQGEQIGFDAYLELSNEVSEPVDAYVWPEYALTNDIRTNPDQLESVRKLLSEKAASQLTLGSRTNHETGEWSNTAVTLGAKGEVLGTHNKNRPVHFFDDGTPGTEVPAFETPVGTISTTICFDNDYASTPRRGTVNGAELFLVPSMDAENWSARQHLQHAELARHRAAENGRWMVVASSSGLTQVIDPYGSRLMSLPLFEKGVIVAWVGLCSHRTIFTSFGWLLGPLCALGTILLIFVSSILSRRKSATGEPVD